MIHKEGELVHADQLMWKETDYVHSAPVHSDLKGHQDEAQDPDVGTSEENLEEKAKKRSRAYCNPVDDIPVGSEGVFYCTTMNCILWTAVFLYLFF